MKPRFVDLLTRYLPDLPSMPILVCHGSLPSHRYLKRLYRRDPWFKGSESKVASSFISLFRELQAFTRLELDAAWSGRFRDFTSWTLWEPFLLYPFDTTTEEIQCAREECKDDWLEFLEEFTKCPELLSMSSPLLALPTVDGYGPERIMATLGYLPLTSGDNLETGRLGQVVEGGGKRWIFAIGNYVRQRLLKPFHDWLMKSLAKQPSDGTFHQTRPLSHLVGSLHSFSYDLKSATDRWPLMLMTAMVEAIWGLKKLI